MNINRILIRLVNRYEKFLDQLKRREHFNQNQLHDTVKLYNPRLTTIRGNIKVDELTYINSGRFLTGENSKITIGKRCAIGHNVTITAITHSLTRPTGPSLLHEEKDTEIGNDVWIGTNVFIKEGVKIGNNCIIGANSVVTKSFDEKSIIGGVPAKFIRLNHDLESLG